MGFLSSVWKGAKDVVSDVWDGFEDITAYDEINDFASDAWSGLTDMFSGQQAPPGGQQMTGPLMGNAPANLTMGSGAQPAPQVSQLSAQDLAGLFSQSGYGTPPAAPASTALLQSNPQAYQYQPLMNGTPYQPPTNGIA